MLVSELIILVAAGLIYYMKTDNVTQKALQQKRTLNIIIRDSYIKYISKKMRIILEDQLLILKTYLNIIDWNLRGTAHKNLKYAPDIKEDGPWYLNSSNYTDYFYGQYNDNTTKYCSKDDKDHFDKLSEFLSKLFKKYLNWKNQIYVNVEYLIKISR